MLSQIIVNATIENLEDLWLAQQGLISADRVRKVFIAHAIVDPKAALVSLPSELMARLGLSRFGPVRLTIQDRSGSMDIKEQFEDDSPVLGHTALTHLDLVVDQQGQSLIGNPAHGGVHTYEMY